MRLPQLWLALVLCSPALAFAGEKKEAPPVTPIVGPATPFSDLMLDVQRVQARMATGDKAAYDEQRQRMRSIGAAIAAAGPDAFKVRAERDAVVVYLLSGGQPRDIATLVARGDFPEAERNLLRGAAGYAGARQADAEKLLAFDPLAESLRLGSQLAYAQSVLQTPKNAKRALELLDIARLLSPGTLIEEAALRREFLLVGDLGDPDRVAFLARQYVERFGASLYAADFVRGLAATAIRFDLCATLGDLEKFSALLALAPPEQARAFLLNVSRASLLLGRQEVAAKAAAAALETAPPGSADEARGKLYAALPRLIAMSADAAASTMAGVALDKLIPADRALAAAAVYARARVDDLPPPSAYAEAWREAAVAKARSPDLPEPDDPADLTLNRAVAALQTAEALGGQAADR